MKKFNGKVAVVTGGGGILCSVMAEALANAGAKVAILDLKEEAAKKVADKINAAGGGYCLGLGFGWNEGYGIGYTKWTVIGKGLGVTWSETNDLENEEGNRLAKDIVEVVAHAGSKIIGK